MHLVSPASFQGDWRLEGQFPGLISMDMRLLSAGGSQSNGPVFRISGPAGTAQLTLPVSAGPSAAHWQTLVVPLDPAIWTVSGTWPELLANVTYFDLDAEFINGDETSGYDNIRLLLPRAETIPSGEIRGAKWNDLDGNGVQDAGEAGLEGWTVFLDADGDSVLDTGETSTSTGADASYSFGNLAPGTYIVAEVSQDGWTQTFPGGADITSSLWPNGGLPSM